LDLLKKNGEPVYFQARHNTNFMIFGGLAIMVTVFRDLSPVPS